MSQEVSFLQVDPKDLKMPVEASVNSQTGDAFSSVSIPITTGRNGFQPNLSLSYNSGSGNSVFGMGWHLQGIPNICLSLKDGYPRYDGSDKYSFGGQELIPWLVEVGAEWQTRTDENDDYYIIYHRAQVDTYFTRFEQWTNKTTREIHWRVHSSNNQVMIFGKASDHSSKITDPKNSKKIFQWLLEAQYDNMGNAIVFEYQQEDHINVDGSTSFERNRIFKAEGNSQKYLKRIRYGNTIPVLPDDIPDPLQNWLFEVILDYGEHTLDGERPLYTVGTSGWPVRQDPFSSYIAGFEQRTYRLCHHDYDVP